MATETVQTDSHLELPPSEAQPLRIPMNPKLFKAARSGDKSFLAELPRSKNVANYLLGVTEEGNTALHMVASRGYLELAEEICRREGSLLTARNTRLDTPLHCAARAGDDEMVSLIIKFAGEDEIERKRVLTAANRNEDNALHEAAKYNHVRVAEVLMNEDAELASMLNCARMSPLYLAIAIGSLEVAKVMLQSSSRKKDSPTSYCAGPDKQTALHAAVLMNKEIMKEILKRKPMLSKEADSSGRIPLHYVASNGHRDMAKKLLKHDSSTAYQPDADGFFPIHVAARAGNTDVVDRILKQCPDTDELLDKKGKNFLHVAFEFKRLDLVKKIIFKRPDLKKLLNDQDNQGNTPLHTAVKNGDQDSVHFLLREKTVYVNHIDDHGFTPLDLAYAKLDRGLQFGMNAAEVCIASCLALIKALSGPQKLHDLESGESSTDEAGEKPSNDDNVKGKSSRNKGYEIGKRVNLAKNLGIATVLIATVTFAAGFTLPGGYIADYDHPRRGTAVLAKEYTFKVFLVSDAFALVCSIVATCWLMYAGTAMVDVHTRGRALFWSISCLWVAFAGMSTAFAMGIYVVLPPSCKRISILFCIIALGAPLLAHLVANYNAYSVLQTVIFRQGCRQSVWPTIRPHDKKRLGHNSHPIRHLVIFLLMTLGAYAIFFLLAML